MGIATSRQDGVVKPVCLVRRIVRRGKQEAGAYMVRRWEDRGIELFGVSGMPSLPFMTLPKRQKLIDLSYNFPTLCLFSHLAHHDPPLSETIQLTTNEEACIGFIIERELVYDQPRCARCRKFTRRSGLCGGAQATTVAGQSQYPRAACHVTHGWRHRRSSS